MQDSGRVLPERACPATRKITSEAAAVQHGSDGDGSLLASGCQGVLPESPSTCNRGGVLWKRAHWAAVRRRFLVRSGRWLECTSHRRSHATTQNQENGERVGRRTTSQCERPPRSWSVRRSNSQNNPGWSPQALVSSATSSAMIEDYATGLGHPGTVACAARRGAGARVVETGRPGFLRCPTSGRLPPQSRRSRIVRRSGTSTSPEPVGSVRGP